MNSIPTGSESGKLNILLDRLAKNVNSSYPVDLPVLDKVLN